MKKKEIIEIEHLKPQKEPKGQISNPFNSVEFAKVGEIVLSSEVINARELLNLISASLRNNSIKKYLGIVERKKAGGNYFG